MKIFFLNTVERRLVNKTKQAESKAFKILIGLRAVVICFFQEGLDERNRKHEEFFFKRKEENGALAGGL